MKYIAIVMAALILAGCGGEDADGSDQSGQLRANPPTTSTSNPTPTSPPPVGGDQCLSGTSLVHCDSLESGIALTIGTTAGSDSTCVSSLFSLGPCDPREPSGNDSIPAGVLAAVSDLEPNNDSGTATVANFPTREVPGQRIGFTVSGSVEMLADGVDMFAVSLPARARFDINLCFEGEGCGWNNPDVPEQLVGVDAATVRILDQFGNEVFDTGDSHTPGNKFKAELEGGVVYYLVIVAEASSGSGLQYFFRVMESYYQPDDVAGQPVPELEPTVAPLPPTLSVFVVSHDSEGLHLDVQLDWTIPLLNDDGAVLDDLAGFKIYIGLDESAITRGESVHVITIDDPLLTTSTYNLIEWEGMWVCMTAFNSEGVESEVSELFLIERGPDPENP